MRILAHPLYSLAVLAAPIATLAALRWLWLSYLAWATHRAASAAYAAERARLDRPRVVTLCGSTRFRDDFHRANRALTLAGRIVLAPGVFGHADGTEVTAREKVELDGLHLRKIDLSDEVYVINPGGYIGQSTRREIAYALATGKPVHYLNSPAETAAAGREG